MRLGKAEPTLDSLLITMVLDKSGSMEPSRTQVINGFNKFRETQASLPAKTWMTLVQFDTTYTVNYVAQPIRDTLDLSLRTYTPNGCTALLDAVGRAVGETTTWLANQTLRLPDEVPTKTLFAIYTDGHENSSREYTKQSVSALIDRQREDAAWEFVFLGADQDAWDNAQAYGVAAAGNTLSFNSSDTSGAWQRLSNATTTYRSASTPTAVMDFFNAEREPSGSEPEPDPPSSS